MSSQARVAKFAKLWMRPQQPPQQLEGVKEEEGDFAAVVAGDGEASDESPLDGLAGIERRESSVLLPRLMSALVENGGARSCPFLLPLCCSLRGGGPWELAAASCLNPFTQKGQSNGAERLPGAPGLAMKQPALALLSFAVAFEPCLRPGRAFER